MTTKLSIVCLVCSVSTAWSADLPNGIYQVVENGEGKLVDRTMGGQVELGERLSENFGEVSIQSVSNPNDLFRVSLKQAGPVETRGPLALCIDGVCEVIGARGNSEGSGKLDLIAAVSGAENARRIAVALNTTVAERKHPGYLLAVAWRPLKPEFKVGEAVTLELCIKNVGQVPVRFLEGGQNRGPRDNQFGFTAFSGLGAGKAFPDTGDTMNFGGLGAYRTLKPGEIFRKQVDVTKWFKFEKGLYLITGTYQLNFYDEDFRHSTWEDFVTGRCTVIVVK